MTPEVSSSWLNGGVAGAATQGAEMIRNVLCATVALAIATGIGAAAPAQAGPTLDKVKQAGALTCGVPTGIPGFAQPDNQGKYAGFDVDICRAISAALFGEPDKVKYVPLTAQQRFTALQSGEVDILSNNTTWTLLRDTQLGQLTRAKYFVEPPAKQRPPGRNEFIIRQEADLPPFLKAAGVGR